MSAGARASAWLFFLLACAYTTVLTIALILGKWPAAVLPSIYATPAMLLILLFIAIFLACAGADRASRPALIAGILFCVGGAAFDMIATVLHSPDLAREENAFVRWMLRTEHQLSSIYAFGLVCQALLVAIVVALWVAMLKNSAYLKAQAKDARGFFALLKAASGGAHLTYRQWLLPLRIREIPDSICLLSFTTALLVAGFALRWQLGLEWFGFFFAPRPLVGIASLLAATGGYLVWLRLGGLQVS